MTGGVYLFSSDASRLKLWLISVFVVELFPRCDFSSAGLDKLLSG